MQNKLQNTKLGVIGCGKMASAILGGVVKNEFLLKDDIFIYDVNKDIADKMSSEYGFFVVETIEELLKKTNTILLATKPFVVEDVLNKIKPEYNNHLIMSILAGVKIKKYLSILQSAKIVRIMPNTPALVNTGMSAICISKNVTISDYEFALDFMGNCGRVIKTTEDKMDAITALSGSGPAFYFKIIELMAKSAQKLGLKYDEALLLSAQTALGSAKMVFENNFDINQLIKNVTTPGGCTEVGNNILNSSDIDKIFDKTLKSTMQKAIELG